MNGLRFKVGELAIFMFARGEEGAPFQGETCQVIDVGPWKAGDEWRPGFKCFRKDSDYVIQMPQGAKGQCMDYQLRKLDPPAEPESITRREEVEA